MGLIDKNALADLIKPEDDNDYDSVMLLGDVRKLLHNFVNDAPEVDPIYYAGGCYCAECEKFDPDEIVATNMGTCWHSNMVKRFDDFCSNGRRREGGE